MNKNNPVFYVFTDCIQWVTLKTPEYIFSFGKCPVTSVRRRTFQLWQAPPDGSVISIGQIMYQRTSCNYLYSKNSVFPFKERKWAVWQHSFSSAHFSRVHADGWLMTLRPVAFLTPLSALKTNYTFHPDNMSITRFGNSCRSIKYFVWLNNS